MKQKVYDMIITILALLAAVLAVMDFAKGLSQWEAYVDNGIWMVFIIDYVVRLCIAKKKRAFVRENILDLVAIFPYNWVFNNFRILKVARILRLVQLSRVTACSLRIWHHSKVFFEINGFKYTLLLATLVTILGGLGISYAENLSVLDGLWWAVVTVSTVGYGDIAPKTDLGRMIAVIVMLFGIGLIGALTGTITSYFFVREREHSNPLRDATMETIKGRLDIIEELSNQEIEDICRIIGSFKKKDIEK